MENKERWFKTLDRLFELGIVPQLFSYDIKTKSPHIPNYEERRKIQTLTYLLQEILNDRQYDYTFFIQMYSKELSKDYMEMFGIEESKTKPYQQRHYKKYHRQCQKSQTKKIRQRLMYS